MIIKTKMKRILLRKIQIDKQQIQTQIVEEGIEVKLLFSFLLV